MPNVIGIFMYCPVCREDACTGDVHKRHLLPLFLIRPNGNGVLLHTSVIGKICKNHIRVVVDDVGNFGETLSCNIIFRDEVNDVMQLLIVVVVIHRVVAAALELVYLRSFHAENKDVVAAYGVMNFNVCTVHCAEGYGAVEHKLHIARTARLCAGKRNLLRNVGGRHKLFGHCYVIILNVNNLESAVYVGVVVYHFAESIYKADYFLRHIVACGCLCAKDVSVRSVINTRICLNHKVIGKNIERVEMLTLVLVKSLYLHVKN